MEIKHYRETTMIILTFFFVFLFDYPAIGSTVKEKNKREILTKVNLLQIPFIENENQIK